ncbi:MAG: hypothetical protein ACXAB2_04775 [Candidatus Hodarchaeales archaeon]
MDDEKQINVILSKKQTSVCVRTEASPMYSSLYLFPEEAIRIGTELVSLGLRILPQNIREDSTLNLGELSEFLAALVMQAKQTYFQYYYMTRSATNDILTNPLTLKFRQIKIQTFQDNWILPQYSFITPQSFYAYLTKIPQVPAHIYATILRFLNASRLTIRAKPAYCLSGPLVLDFDHTTHPLYSDGVLTQLKKQIIDTMDFLTDWYNLTDFHILFSGYKGFHLYTHDFLEKCLKKYNNSKSWGTQRESYERQQRYRIVWQLRQAGITCDFPVSTDTRRVIRVPGTLHGKTGFLCYPLHSIQHLHSFQIDDAKPLNYLPILQKKNVQVEVIRSLPPFKWENMSYSGKLGVKLEVPISLAVVLLLQQDVKLGAPCTFAELLE